MANMHFVWGDTAVITGCVDRRSGTELFSSTTILWSLNSLRAVRLFATARCWICAGKLINLFITINYNYVSAHVGHVYLRKSLYRVHYPAFYRGVVLSATTFQLSHHFLFRTCTP
jgi:hypothetical protein